MSERKAINKYYPPDYNPIEAEKQASKLAKKLKTKNKNVVTIRLMTPFSIRCLKCSEFIPKSRKFNGKKEMLPDRYLDSIKIYRLSIKCPTCNNLISFKTDPKASDYIMEVGGERNYYNKTQEDNQKRGTDVTETVDEALERLTTVQKQEQLELQNKNDTDDKMKVLEQKLTQMQKQQEDDEELEHLKKLSYIRMKNATQLHELTSQDIEMKEADEYERKAQQVFDNAITKTTNNKIDLDAPDNINLFHKDALIKIRKKSSLKKVNPLGIKVKKKKH